MATRRATCTVQRCKRPMRVGLWCKTHAKQKCDELFGQLIRARGVCESGRPSHKGSLQCAHGFSRRYLPTRWDPRNAWALCAGCHLYFTERPLEWDDWMVATLSRGVYDELRGLALATDVPIDYEAVYQALSEAHGFEVTY